MTHFCAYSHVILEGKSAHRRQWKYEHHISLLDCDACTFCYKDIIRKTMYNYSPFTFLNDTWEYGESSRTAIISAWKHVDIWTFRPSNLDWRVDCSFHVLTIKVYRSNLVLFKRAPVFVVILEISFIICYIKLTGTREHPTVLDTNIGKIRKFFAH